MPETHRMPHENSYDTTPELLADMTRADLVHVLQYLPFAKNGMCVIRIDKLVRDFLVDRLSHQR